MFTTETEAETREKSKSELTRMDRIDRRKPKIFFGVKTK